MDAILMIIAGVLLAVGGCFALSGDLHMLQQNSYYLSRYGRWLKGSLGSYTLRIFWAVVLCVASFNIYALTAASALYALIYALSAPQKQKKAIKPLVVTARVKRQFFTAAVILLGCAVGAYFWTPAVYLLILFACVTPLTACVVKLINEPIEAAVRQYFIADAKRILRRHKPMTVIGITGSYGKTGTKFALARILQEKYNVAFTPASFNTPMGVVRTIREQLKPTDDIFIVEMGAKNIGDIKEICDIVHPDIAIITSVGPQHLETFKTLDNVARTKFELADAVKDKGGRIYLNVDSEPIAAKAGEYTCIRYGSRDADSVISDVTSGRYGASFTLNRKGEAITLQTKLLGAHNVQNLAGVVTVAIDLGVSERDIRFAVSKLDPVEHRLQLKPFINGSLLIDDAYNANPAGSLAAVDVLASFEGCRKIIVTPGLVELGDKEYQYNFDLGKKAAQLCDEIVLVGEKRSIPLADGARSVGGFPEERLHIVPTFKEAMTLLSGMTDSSCAVLFENDLPDNYSK